MKLIWILLLALVTSCAQYQRIDHLESGDSIVTELENAPEGFLEAQTADVSEDLNLLEVKKFNGFTKQEIGRFWQYAKKVDDVTQSSCFADAIKAKVPLYNNKDETVQELIETLRVNKPQLNFTMYYKNNSTVGYTYANSDTIWFNRKYHSNFSICQAAANLAHERSHKLKYTHDFKSTARRPHQVPYPVGNLLKQCCYNNSYIEPEREKVYVCRRSWVFFKKCYWTYK